MIVWACVIAYAVIGVILWRRFAWRRSRIEARTWMHDSYVDGGNVMLGIVLGGLQALVWPVSFLVVLGIDRNAFSWFLSEPAHVKRERELEERERKIRQMERELGIGQR